MAYLTVVGTGLGKGQITESGAAALRESAWIGHFGLPPEVRSDLALSRGTVVDLDDAADARRPVGFAARARDILLEAALRVDQAALAVAGHPLAANPFSAWLCESLPALGVEVRVCSAPSALDQFMACAGVDLVGRAISVVDALRWLRDPVDDAGRSLAIWNAGYLDHHGLALLHGRVARRFPSQHPVHAFRTTADAAHIERWPVGDLRFAFGRIDYATTLFIF